MGTFNEYLEEKESSTVKETMREIQIVMNKAIDNSQRVKGFGINDIKFEVINQEEGETGTQINLEAKGSAVAKNEQHLSRMLQKLVNSTREDLWKKNIFFEFHYHKIDISDTKMEETDIDLKKSIYFTVICAACVFK